MNAGSSGRDSGHLFLMFGRIGLCRNRGNSLLGKILTGKNLIYLLNFLFSVIKHLFSLEHVLYYCPMKRHQKGNLYTCFVMEGQLNCVQAYSPKSKLMLNLKC